MQPQTAHRSKWPRRVGIAVFGLAAFSVVGVIANMLLTPSPPAHHRIQQVVVFRAVPPPPPKPPEKPPEPPKKQEEVKLDQPRPIDTPKAEQPQAPAPGPLGLDSQGTGPGDGFGLAGRPGGRDITLGGSGSGGLGFNVYANGAARFIAQELARNDRLRKLDFKVELKVWMSRDGHLERFELARGTGDAATDAMIRDGLMQVGPYRQPMPENLPQPMRIRVTSSDV
jgi:protein TonB